jgi:hypothetical protein
MSALPPKADIRPRDQDVCFGPQADSCTAAKSPLAGLRLLCFRPHEPAAALQILDRPDCIEIVEFRNRLGAPLAASPAGGRENVLRTARSSRRRRSGLATTSISTIRPSVILKQSTMNSCPRGAIADATMNNAFSIFLRPNTSLDLC